MTAYLPNSLTILRILLVPVFIWLIFFYPQANGIIWATIVFIVASITDYLDGMLARRLKVISNFGKIMDPLADKILIISALLALYLKLHYINLIVFGIIIFREIIVSIFREFFARHDIIIPANIWGKIKTVMQMTAVIVILLVHSFLIPSSYDLPWIKSFRTIMDVFFWIIAFLTIFSGLIYMRTIIRREY
ncbi:MAG: CDP-diacylglycerol--glycerol-3-phosphate 3-phosphatidyltransferase [Candidatus Cloacimonetes bacterium]|nr:CDP-diacylglycerol--glycerol-3-phosphate 3-phosphatidyltransferase [Candidatus Cloacimonadota bacterium]